MSKSNKDIALNAAEVVVMAKARAILRDKKDDASFVSTKHAYNICHTANELTILIESNAKIKQGMISVAPRIKLS